MLVRFPPLSEIINDSFIPSWRNRNRYLIEWGGRGSAKSVTIAKKLIIRCLREKYFRYILYRNVFDTIRDSQYQTIKDIVEEWKLEDLFIFTRSPLEITCINGNKFLARGGDKTTKIKSIKDPTGVWYEEDIPKEDDFYNISGSIRTTKANYLQEVFTINPEVEGHYEDNWFFKRFFKGKYPHELTFNGKTTTIIEGNPITLSYYCHHSTYKDNRFLPDEYRALLEQYKFTNPYKYTVHTLGLWGLKEISDRFWKNFSIKLHVDNIDIDIDSPLHLSFDENVRPYPALSIWQIDGLEVYQVNEICLRTPKNKLPAVCDEFIRWAKSIGWKNKIYLYGDASSDKEDAKLEKGVNYWTMMRGRLSKYCPVQMRKPVKNPPVALSAEFINQILQSNYAGISIMIHESCRESINDYMFAEEAQDGTMKKVKKDGVELLGHISDTFRYFICEAFKSEFRRYQRDEFDKSKYSQGHTATDRSF